MEDWRSSWIQRGEDGGLRPGARGLRNRARVWECSGYILSECDESHSFGYERSKMIELFGPKRACLVPNVLNIFFFVFDFIACL
jgi:hypothetical protein